MGTVLAAINNFIRGHIPHRELRETVTITIELALEMLVLSKIHSIPFLPPHIAHFGLGLIAGRVVQLIVSEIHSEIRVKKLTGSEGLSLRVAVIVAAVTIFFAMIPNVTIQIEDQLTIENGKIMAYGGLIGALMQMWQKYDPNTKTAIDRIKRCKSNQDIQLDLSHLGLMDLPREIEALCQMITSLNLRGNKLTDIKEIKGFTNLQQLDIRGNPLSSLPLSCINLLEASAIRYDNKPANNRIIIELVLQTKDFVSRLPHLALDDRFVSQLSQWLSRFKDMKDYRKNSPSIRQTTIKYLTLANSDPTFKEGFFRIIEGADTTCGDRMAFSILQLSQAYKISQFLAKPQMNPEDMQDVSEFILRGIWALKQLEHIAEGKINILRQNRARDEIDEIEIYLGFPVLLKSRLQLQFDVDEMLFSVVSGIEARELDAAAEIIEAALRSREAQIEILSTEDLWGQALAKYCPDSYAQILKQRDETSEAQDPNYEQIQANFRTEKNRLTAEVMEACGI